MFDMFYSFGVYSWVATAWSDLIMEGGIDEFFPIGPIRRAPPVEMHRWANRASHEPTIRRVAGKSFLIASRSVKKNWGAFFSPSFVPLVSSEPQTNMDSMGFCSSHTSEFDCYSNKTLCVVPSLAIVYNSEGKASRSAFLRSPYLF
tara:strand:- start:1388 stop:1825 length:438 start_codon:yes stop_codon:yes gene_type:complete